MKFVLELWPDIDTDNPVELIRFARARIAENDELAWDIVGDDGQMYHANVTAPFTVARAARPYATCGCGYELVYVVGGWEHNAAPSLWGDDHEANPNAIDEKTQDLCGLWDIRDGITRQDWTEIDPVYEDADDWRLDLAGTDTLEIGPTGERYSIVFVRRDPDNGETISEETIGYQPTRDEAMDLAEQYKNTQYQPTEKGAVN